MNCTKGGKRRGEDGGLVREREAGGGVREGREMCRMIRAYGHACTSTVRAAAAAAATVDENLVYARANKGGFSIKH